MTRKLDIVRGTPRSNRPAEDADRGLWRRYREDRDLVARAELLDRHLGLVHHAVNTVAIRLPSGLDREDLVSAGTLGLMQAVETYDPDRGAAFSSFALPRIRGAVLDELRSWDWVPRSTRDRARELRDAQNRLRRELGREAGPAEVAAALGIDLETYWRRAGESAEPVVLPIDGASAGGGTGDLGEAIADRDAPDAEKRLEREDTLAALARGFGALSERDRTVLTLSFYERLTLQQIGEVLRVSESRVSRIRARALKRLLQEVEPEEMAA